ncbi:MAG TPA: VanW family protein [Cellulomonas sp.]
MSTEPADVRTEPADVPAEPAGEPVPPTDVTDEQDDPTVVMAPVVEPVPAPVVEPGPSAPTRVSAFPTTPVPAAESPQAGAFPATSTPAAESPRVTAGPVPVQEREPSMLDVFPVQVRRRRWPLRLAIVVGILVLLAGAYVGMSYALRDKVPHGATVAGVEIGGLTSSQAVQRLTTQLADATGRPLTVTAHDVQGAIDPVAAGLTFDPKATVDGLTGVRLSDPRQLWRQVVGIGEVTPVTSVDQAALATAVDGLSDTLSADPVDGAIVFVDGSPHATPAADGWKLDQDAAVRQIAGTWLVAARPLALPTTTVAPDITQAETDQTLADVAQHVSGGPVSVTVGDKSASLAAPVLAANASFVPQDGALVLEMNGQALSDALLAQLPGVLTPAADAHFAFQNDAPVVVPGQAGTTLDPAQVATAIAAAASKPTDRSATLTLVPTDPSQSTAALEALGVKEIVSEFDTPLTADHVRDINIKQGAANITGVLIRPGETFSLTDAIGPIDTAHGFVPAGALVDGQHTDAMGGGLSQVSTTTFNAAYLAGFEIVEHTPHSQWFSRYPEGREATIFTGQIDMKWKNNSPYGALVQAWVGDDHHVHVRIWGTKYWTVQSVTSARSNVHPPTTVYDQSAGCEPAAKGNPGFTVSVTRTVYLGTELKDTHRWTTTYKPQNQTVCGPPPAS